MLTSLTNVSVWVHDQDEALEFYTEKLGLELRDDVTVPEMGNFRWLTVGVPGQKDVSIALMAVPGPPVFEAETAEQIKSLVSKGVIGGLFFAADDVQASYEELKGRGVEFVEQPVAAHDIEGTSLTLRSILAPPEAEMILTAIVEGRNARIESWYWADGSGAVIGTTNRSCSAKQVSVWAPAARSGGITSRTGLTCNERAKILGMF